MARIESGATGSADGDATQARWQYEGYVLVVGSGNK